VRLQLRPPTAFAAALVLGALVPRAGHATSSGEASARMTLFDEAGSTKEHVRVLHPQVDASANIADAVSFAAGYNVDIVTGATPKTFQPDAISTATAFHDTRHLVHGAFGFESPGGGVSFGLARGWESDYKSWSLSATTHHDLYEHNFSLGLAYTHNWDSVCDANNVAAAGLPLQLVPLANSATCFQSNQTMTVTHPLAIDSFEPSLSWTMTPRLVVQGGATIQVLNGFQSNPYRAVLLGSENRQPQEHEPQYRQRYALFGRLAYAFPELRASTLVMLRIYDDSWAVRAVTGDVTANKYLSQAMLLSVRGHYHVQSGASFYRTSTDYRFLGPNGQYWTGDRELSPMSNILMGGKFGYLRKPHQERSAWFVEMELDAKYELMLYQVAPDAPNAVRKFAHIVQGAFSLRF
jgi:hypothetical protein